MRKRTRTSRKETPARREEIVRWLKRQGTLTYEQIQKRFKVAPMTSRRDVAALDQEGKAIKTLRGAIVLSQEGILSEGPLFERLGVNLPAKRAIARIAVELIKPGSIIHLDGGTTCIELARLIVRSRIAVTVVTNSILVAACFCEDSSAKIILLGGALNPLTGCVTGADTEKSVQSFFIDMGFFTTLGYIPGEGTYESSTDTLGVKLAVAQRCAEAVLLLDHSKFGRRALSRVFVDSQIHKIITDLPPQGFKDPRLMLAP